MVVDNICFHNVAELKPVDGGGVQLLRVPESVRSDLSERGSQEMGQPTNCEIRFKSTGNSVSITLSALDKEVTGVLFHGCFMTRHAIKVGLEPQTFTFEKSKHIQVYEQRGLRHGHYSPDVWRFMFAGGTGSLVFHDLQAENVSAPEADDLPALRYMAYGTSLTAGRATTGPHLAYASQTAWRLGADLINLGSGGSCYCEPEMARYIADRDDWDFATLGLSLNMLAHEYDDFYEKVNYLVSTIANKHKDKHIFCITNWPCFYDYKIFIEETPVEKKDTEKYREILRKVVKDLDQPKLHLLEGPELFPGFYGESDDLIHPSDLGMIQMAENLTAEMLKKLES